MKKILVPTDFSENANNALEYAIAFANAFGSEITLLHTYRVYNPTGSFVSVETFMKEDIASEMLKVVKTVEPKLENNASVVSKIVKGDIVDAIAGLTERQPYDLIIMGTQGASGLAEVFIGSTTNSVIKNVSTPVLAIPSGFKYRPIRTIVLAVDEEESFGDHLFDPLTKIARHCGAMIRVYHKDVENDGLNTAIDKYLEGLERTYHYELDSENINEGINSFSIEHQADMLCMIRRRRGFLERIFHDSVTTRQVFNSSVSLLILHQS